MCEPVQHNNIVMKEHSLLVTLLHLIDYRLKYMLHILISNRLSRDYGWTLLAQELPS